MARLAYNVRNKEDNRVVYTSISAGAMRIFIRQRETDSWMPKFDMYHNGIKCKCVSGSLSCGICRDMRV